ncbi:unnamed protein product [Rotaria socialis]|uniref:UBA domain-containing protein n=2 Tax=Rotaria socialis TaxID=392032 RepID=A0A820RI09_9BILA|nr:unnamed protein product [Rotaria socialis]CAF3350916.1 unnamed protein product [Rotaria socialis]CAF3473071.1 unnamed protein product [Rotaria socialis]CAF3795823.1 unnamed protein product [Rotaria socialis]CAF4273842.1 unnamed protein product [Rotaria socialis]
MQRISLRRQQLDNQNNKRWSTSLIDNNDQEEQISCQSSCLTLLTNKLGIPQEKAERACVATGFRSVQAATDWLLQRCSDDRLIRTEFIILLCPDKQLHEEIRTFNGELFRYLAKGTTLLNDRQYLRAFKLSSFFHIPDRHVHTFHKVFDSVMEQYHRLFKQLLRVVLYTTNDYLMLIPDTETKNIVQNIFDMLKQQFEKIVPTVSILPAKKLAHLTLTHGLSTLFNLPTDQRASLLQFARLYFDLDRPVNWSLRLYSREKSSMNETVYRVVSSTKETTINKCLLLKANDLFMVLDNGRIGEQENVFGE